MFDKLKRFAAIYAFIFAWALPLSAIALTPAQRVVLFSGGVKPTATLNFATQTYTGSCASFSSCVSFSRAGNAMQYDATGKLTWGPNNLVLQSNTFSNASWTKSNSTITNANSVSDPFGGTQASTLTSTANGGYILQNTGAWPGQNINSIWIRRRTGTGTITYYNPNETPINVTSSVSGAWAQIYLTGDGSATNYNYLVLGTNGDAVDIYAATSSRVTYETTPRSIDQVITTSAAYYGPRFDYNPATLAALGLLVEGSATNLAPQSGNMTTDAWGHSLGAFTTDGTLAPDGVSNMGKFTLSSGNGSHEFYNATGLTVTNGGTYTSSVYVKKGNYRYVFIDFEISYTFGVLAVFDLDNPSAATQTWAVGLGNSYIGSNIQNIGGGIYRISVSGVIAGGTTGYLVAGLVGAATGNSTASVEPSFTAAGTETAYFWGGQLESGPFATSNTPTGASSVTRTIDSVTSGTALAAALTAGRSIVQWKDEATGTVSRAAYAPGAFSWVTGKWYQQLVVYPPGVSAAYVNAHLTVNGPY